MGLVMGQEQGTTFLSLMGGLLLFALILWLAWYCTRWLGKRYGLPSAGGGKIKVLERTALGPDRSLVVVRLGKEVWLLGVTAQHIERIAQLDPALYGEEPAADDAGGPGIPGGTAGPGATKFSQMLGQVIGRSQKITQEKEKHDEGN